MKPGRLLLAFCVFACTSAAPPTEDVTALLKRQTQELMDAIAPGHAEVWQRYLHKDVVYVDENGVVYDKERLVRELTPLPAGLVGHIVVDKFQVSRQATPP